MNKILTILILISSILKSQTTDTSGLKLNEIQIVSNRADDKTPVTQITLDKEQINKSYFGQDPAYILGKTPSITFYSDNGLYNSYTYFRLRGLDQTRINMTLNGVPLNEPEDQGAYFSNYSDFSSNLNSIQIQRGVGVSSYGTSSYAGSINFESKNLLDPTQTTIDVGYGSYNTRRVSISHNTGLMDNHFAVYTRASILGTDGYRYNSYNQSQTIFSSIGYYGNKSITKLTAFSGSSKNGMAYLPTNIEDLSVDKRINYLTPNENDNFKQSLISLQYINKLGKRSTLNSTIFYNHLNGLYNVAVSPIIYDYYLKSNFYGIINSYNLELNKFKLNLGLSANNYQRFHSSYINPYKDVALYQNSGIKNDLSVFSKMFYNVGAKVILFGDIQYRYTSFDYIADKSNVVKLSKLEWNFINPKGGLRIKQNDNVSYYTSVGQTHREPTRNDLFNGYDDVTPISSNRYTSFANDTMDINNIKPESVVDYEIGLDYSKRFLFHLNLYYMDFKNEIAPIGKLSYIGLPLRKNIDRSIRTGVESSFQYTYKSFSLNNSTNVSYNKIRNFNLDADSMSYSNTSPLLTPNFVNNFGIEMSISQLLTLDFVTSKSYDRTKSYSFRRNTGVSVGVSDRYVSKSYLDNTENSKFITPSYNIVDSYLVVSYKLFKIKFVVNNVLNRVYYNSGYVSATSNGSKTSAYFIGAPRNYFISINITL